MVSSSSLGDPYHFDDLHKKLSLAKRGRERNDQNREAFFTKCFLSRIRTGSDRFYISRFGITADIPTSALSIVRLANRDNWKSTIP